MNNILRNDYESQLARANRAEQKLEELLKQTECKEGNHLKIIDILRKIHNKEELPQELYYNGDYGELVKYEDFINYMFYNKEDKFDMYWLVDHNLINLDDEVVVGKVKVKEMR